MTVNNPSSEEASIFTLKLLTRIRLVVVATKRNQFWSTLGRGSESTLLS